MKLIIIGVILGSCLANTFAAEVRLIELEPNDAAQIIDKQEQTLRYAPQIQAKVPALRYLGKQQHHVVEDIYLANQYHGQDGLGAYIYGYSVPDIAKTEKKERGGDLKGAYKYIAGNGKEIQVQYWDNGNGFHQVDNVPKDLPEDNPEVKAAKEEHLRIWHEQALRNSIAPSDPNEQYYQQQHPYQPQPIPQQVPHYPPQVPGIGQNVNQPLGPIGYAQPHQQPQISPNVYPSNQGFNQPLNPNSVEYTGQYSSNQQSYAPVPGAAHVDTPLSNLASTDDSVQTHGTNTPGVQQVWAQGPAASASQVANQKTWAPQVSAIQGAQQSQASWEAHVSRKRQEEEEEQTGPPKGFFYSFDYPVGIIVGKDGPQALESIYNQNKAYLEQPQLHPVSA